MLYTTGWTYITETSAYVSASEWRDFIHCALLIVRSIVAAEFLLNNMRCPPLLPSHAYCRSQDLFYQKWHALVNLVLSRLNAEMLFFFFYQNIRLCGVSDWTIPKCNNWSQWYRKELYCLCNMLGAWGKDRTFGPCPAGGRLH